jgi:hypothetical protein
MAEPYTKLHVEFREGKYGNVGLEIDMFRTIRLEERGSYTNPALLAELWRSFRAHNPHIAAAVDKRLKALNVKAK